MKAIKSMKLKILCLDTAIIEKIVSDLGETSLQILNKATLL